MWLSPVCLSCRVSHTFFSEEDAVLFPDFPQKEKLFFIPVSFCFGWRRGCRWVRVGEAEWEVKGFYFPNPLCFLCVSIPVFLLLFPSALASSLVFSHLNPKVDRGDREEGQKERTGRACGPCVVSTSQHVQMKLCISAKRLERDTNMKKSWDVFYICLLFYFNFVVLFRNSNNSRTWSVRLGV